MPTASRVAQLQEMLKDEPKDVFLLYALGLEFAKEADSFESAQEHFNLVLRLDTNYIAAHYQLGQLFELRQKKEEALKQYRDGLEKAKLLGNRKAANEFEEAIFLLED